MLCWNTLRIIGRQFFHSMNHKRRRSRWRNIRKWMRLKALAFRMKFLKEPAGCPKIKKKRAGYGSMMQRAGELHWQLEGSNGASATSRCGISNVWLASRYPDQQAIKGMQQKAREPRNMAKASCKAPMELLQLQVAGSGSRHCVTVLCSRELGSPEMARASCKAPMELLQRQVARSPFCD